MENTQDAKREKALQEVKMYQSNDWDLVEETPEYFLLKRNKATIGGHILVFLFTWYTLGIANLIYYFASVQKKKIIK